MNKNIKHLFVVVFGLLLLLAACKTTKKADSVESDVVNLKTLVRNIENSAYNYKFVSAKSRVNFQDGNMNQSFTANIRMQKDEVIWMSLTGPFGIEGGRVLIDKDSIKIIDRINRIYYNQPFSYIYNFIPFQVDMAMLQSIILGNPLQVNLPKQEVESYDDKYLVKGGFNKIEALYYILPGTYKYHRVELDDSYFSRKFLMDYSDYKQIEGEEFPFTRKLDFKDKQNRVLVDLNFTKVKKENSLDFPFSVPENYKVIK
jgi:outer membrane murein-binding lipoprotein Lpp